MTKASFPDGTAAEAELFRLLVENVKDYAVFVVDGDRKVRTWNPGAERLLGYTEAEILGESADRFFTPEDRSTGQPEREVRQALATGRGDDDRWHVKKDGTRFWAGGVLTPLFDEAGAVRGFAKIMRDRTDLKREEERSRFRSHLLDAVGQAVIATDPAGTVLYWNKSAESLYGWARGEAEGRNVADLVVAPGAVAEAAGIMDRLRSGECWSGEITVRRRDGATFPAFVTDAPILGPDGTLEAIIGVSTDVTDRRHAEAAVRASEERLRTLADNLPHGAVYQAVRDMPEAPTRFTYMSGGGERIFGVSPGQAVADPATIYGLIHPDDIRLVAAAEAEAVRTGGPFDVRFRSRTRSGEAIWVHCRSAPRPVPDGSLVWDGIIFDVTEQVRAEERLRQSEELFRAYFESSTVGMAQADPESRRLVRVNDAFARLTGYAAAELEGMPIADLNHPDDRERDEANFREVVGDGRPSYDIEKRYVRKDGETIWVRAAGTVLRDEAGRPTLAAAVVLDTTERKLAEDERRRSEERFRGLMDQAPFSVQILSADGRTVRVNRAWEELWGVTAGQIGDYNILEDRQLEEKGILPNLRRAFAGEPARLPEIAYDPNETIPDITRNEEPVRWVSAVAYPIKDAFGNVREVALVHEDVTARRKAEAGLRESEAWLRLALDAGRMGTWEWDVRTGRVRWSEGLEEIHGLAPGSFDGTFETYRTLIHPDDLPGLQAAIQGSLKSGTAYEADFRFVRADGTVGWMAGRGKPFYDGAGEPVRMVGVGMDVTDRKAAEAAVRESEHRTRSILESITDAFYAVGTDWRFTYLNHEAERLLGRTRDDLIGKHIWEEFAPAVETDFYPAYHRAMRGTETVRFDVFYPPHEKWYEVHAYPSPDGIAVYFRDITERREVEAALRESEERFRAITDRSVTGIAEVDLSGRFTFVNDRLCEILGRSREELLALRMQDVTHPDDLPTNLPPFERLVRDGTPFLIEKRYVRPDGAAVWVSNSVSGVRDAEGRVKKVVAVSVDVTDRKRAEADTRFLADASAALADLSDPASTLTKVAGLAVPRFADWCSVDMLEDGSLRRVAVAHVDPAKVELAHDLHRRLPPDPAAPSGVWRILRTGESELVPEITDDLLEASVPDPALLGVVRQLGLRSYVAVPLKARGTAVGVLTFVAAESGRRYDERDLAVVEDLARRAAVALENARLYADLRDADRRKDEFLAMLAHELRNPLAPIRSGLDLLKMEGGDSEVVEVMSEQVGHLVRLVDDLLDVSRILRGKVELKKEPTDLSAVLRRAADSVRPRTEEHRQRLHVSLPDEEVRLDADPVRLTQVVSNLLNNASKYTDDGGEVRLEAERRDGEIVIRVSDTGIGIESSLLLKVFDLFTQADQALDRSQGGLGIGLTVVKSLVEMHGGGVEVASDGVGRGATFTVRLPVNLQAEAGVGDVPAVAPAPACRVLVVDDNAPAAKLLGRLLEKLGDHRVLAAHDGPSALTAAAEFRPDLILLDIGLPRMDGYEVARRLRAMPEFSDTLLVALTGYGTQDDRRRSIEAGFDDHVTKPPGVDLLRRVLAHPKLKDRKRSGQ